MTKFKKHIIGITVILLSVFLVSAVSADLIIPPLPRPKIEESETIKPEDMTNEQLYKRLKALEKEVAELKERVAKLDGKKVKVPAALRTETEWRENGNVAKLDGVTVPASSQETIMPQTSLSEVSLPFSRILGSVLFIAALSGAGLIFVAGKTRRYARLNEDDTE